jgi:hypothetical protein
MNMIFEEGLRQVMLGHTSFSELRDLPRGDYIMKSPLSIIRDATETPVVNRVDLINPPEAQIRFQHSSAEVSSPQIPSSDIQRVREEKSLLAAQLLSPQLHLEIQDLRSQNAKLMAAVKLRDSTIEHLLRNPKVT